MHVKTLSALALFYLLTATAFSQSPAPVKEAPKPLEKIGEKTLAEWVKIAVSDPDPASRQNALFILRNFPHAEIRKAPGVTKALVAKMAPGGEPDNGVRINLIDTVATVGVDDPTDLKEALRILATSANGGASVLRLHAIQALGQFGPKAHSAIGQLLGNEVPQDPSFEIRLALAHTLGQISSHEVKGPSLQAITTLYKTLARDPSLPVRLEALHSLFILGPPYSEDKKTAEQEPPVDETAAKSVVNYLKNNRLAATKSTQALEHNKQAELWCRLVIVRFGLKLDLEEQLNGIAAHFNDPESAVRLQALELVGLLGPLALAKRDAILERLNDKEPLVRSAALFALGRMGEKMEGKAFDAIIAIIFDSSQEMKVRIDALAALGMLGEKVPEKARELIMTKIVQDHNNLKSADGVALLQQALITLASTGVKAKPLLKDLEALKTRVRDEKLKRMDGPEWKNLMANPLFIKHFNSLKPDEQKNLLENQAEDQLIKFIDNAITFIQESVEGRPGPEHKK